MTIKQVIVIRKDLKMRRGKEVAQGSHASMAFITRRLYEYDAFADRKKIEFSNAELEWLNNSFAKVVVRVNSEEELLEIEKKAKEEGLECHLVMDSGFTEFHGVPQKTCLAIGPDYADKIDKVTGSLELY